MLAVVKGTFTIDGRQELPLATAQAPITLGDEYHGEPGQSSIRFASDIVPEKRGTDVVLVGSAHAPHGETVSLMVTLEAGPLRLQVAVIGDRWWQRSGSRGVHITKAAPFSSMPLVYERAFGGEDRSDPQPRRWALEPRNPIGRGIVASASRPDLAEVALPNIEDPADLIDDPLQRPRPMGLGFIAPSWKPRVDFAGTHDESWQRDRFPLPPTDFDARFYNGAHPNLISPRFFVGGEPVRLTNASQRGTLQFRIPDVEVLAAFYIDGQTIEKRCDLDTVVIEPDQQRLMLTWRASAHCHRKVKYVAGARVVHRGRIPPP
jgi:hypothetical protein